jgi:hypothetical protein
MKLAEIEDAGMLVTKQDLDAAVELLAHRISDQFHKELIELLKWMTVMFVGFGTIILGGVYFMLAHVKP